MRLGGLDFRETAKLKNLPRYFRERQDFIRQGGRIDRSAIFLGDYEDASGTAKGHYFHQDLLVAQRIFEANPEAHADVGSRVDGFVAHVATFRSIDVLDIRPLKNDAHPNIRFVQADLMRPIDELIGRYPSVSCLHALEHFGLGRYSDPIDPKGHLKGFDAVAKMVRSGGTLYISVPVSAPARVEFNGQRVFNPTEPIEWAADQFTLAHFDYVDDEGSLHRGAAADAACGLKYGCGIYTFIRSD